LSEKNISGQAGIIDGKIIVTNPQGDGTPALLYPAEEGLNVFVNGKLLEAPLEVFEDDVIEITPLVLTEEARCIAKVSSDAYSAELTVFPRVVTEYQLLNTEMSNTLKLQTKKNVKLEKAITLEEADAALKEKNVVYGIDFASLKNAVDRASGEPVVVAKGKELKEGVNGRIEFLTSTEVETITHDESSRNVDLRERYRFPVVKKGDLIAKIHPPVPGVSGQTVTGKITVPKPVKNARFKCGEGVDFLEEKGEIIASRDGRLIISGTTIKVVNLITHNGDVNLESGNLRFSGDIRIYGNIMENMLVEAKGNLFVDGNGFGAVIKAGEGIQFTKNIIKCRVEGGLLFALLKTIILHVRMLEKEYSTFLNAVRQVISSLAGKRRGVDRDFFRRVALAVLQKVSSNMPERLARIESALKDNSNQQFDSLKKTMELLKSLFSGTLEMEGMDILENIGDSLEGFLAKGENLLKEIPPLNASYVQNSVLKHSGDIKIVGAGSYYSRLQAGGSVTVEGVCRGGTIEAEGDVRVKEFLIITTENVATTSHIRIKVPAHSCIYFNLVYEDVTVQVGKMVYRFDHEYSNVKVGYDSASGKLKLSNF